MVEYTNIENRFYKSFINQITRFRQKDMYSNVAMYFDLFITDTLYYGLGH